MKNHQYDVIVVGGGASGMMAAGTAGASGKRVLLLERNLRLGEKLRISGGGRCNITNAERDVKKLLAHFGSAEQFLYSSFSQFGVDDTFSFFESRGLPLDIEANNRAFPHTKRAVDVVTTLEEYMSAQGVDVIKGGGVSSIRSEKGRITGVVSSGVTYTATSYILSVGGVSHPETGSNGVGFTWLRELGHTVEEPTPTIVPLKVREKWVRDLSGITAPDARISFYLDGNKKLSKKGNILFTHFGLSGPTVLNLAGSVGDLLYEGEVTARIDLFPDMDLGILDRHIATVFESHKNKLLRNVFREIVAPGMADGLLSMLPQINPETKVHSVRKEERRAIAELCKQLTLTVSGLMGFERAVVADGGVLLSEVDTRTMRSKKYENLFLTGDLLHITRPSGGYSLQLCWTTGYVAGVNA